MSSSVCYITTSSPTTTKIPSTTNSLSETSNVSTLFNTSSANTNNAKKSSLINRSSPNYVNCLPAATTLKSSTKSHAISYLTQLNTNLNSNNYNNNTNHIDSNNNTMILNTTLEILNELHQQHNNHLMISNCNSSGSNITNESDINLDLVSRNSNGTSSGTSSVISNPAFINQSTPPQQNQKLKKKVQFISNEIDLTTTNINTNKNEETILIDPVITSITNSSLTDTTLKNSSMPLNTNSTTNNFQLDNINDINELTTNLNDQKNINIPIKTNQQQTKPISSIIRNKNLMTNSLNRNFTPSPSCPYSYSFSLVNNSKRQSSASYRSNNNGEQINKSQTIPYLSSYSYAAAANRSYRNSDTRHHYQFMSSRQHYHQAVSPSTSFQPTLSPSASFQRAVSPTTNSNRFNIRSSMTMPAIHHNTSDLYSSTRSYRNTSLNFKNAISEKDNPFRPEGELAKEAEEFVQKLKEKQEHDINQILNATVSSTSPLPSPNSTLRQETAEATAPTSSPKKETTTSSPSKQSNKQVDTAPAPTTPTKQNESTTLTTPVNNESKTASTNNNKKEANGSSSGEKKKTKPKCGCVIS